MKEYDIIRKALKKTENPVIAFSGGKDSTVVLDLVRSIKPDVKAVFCNTGVEARETIQYCNTIDNLIELRPDKVDFWGLAKKYGYPDFKGKKGHHDGNKCCVYLKEKPAMKYYRENKVDLVFTGITKAESRNRMLLLKHRGLLYYAKSWKMWKCHPIGDWTEKRVWKYIKENNISYNNGYDMGWRRCGCQPCTAHKNWGRRLATENPKLLKFILRQRYGQRQCGDYYSFGDDIAALKPKEAKR